MKRIKSTLLLALSVFFTSCSTLGVATSGGRYFDGKKEEELVKYFKYEGEAVKVNGDYDKALYFTNLVSTVFMDKTTVEKFKNKKTSKIFNLYYHDLWDGCLIYPGKVVHRSFVNGALASHQNNNNDIKNQLKQFDYNLKSLNAVPDTQSEIIFKQTAIGNDYYTYSIKRSGFSLDDNGDKTTAYECTYTINKISVYEDSKSSTETHTAYIYNDREKSYTDEKGNAITKETALQNKKSYISKGFSSRKKNKGLALTAYIKDGVVVKVETVE